MKKLLLLSVMLLATGGVILAQGVAPTRTIKTEKELTVSGSTFPAANLTKFSVAKVPDLAFNISSFSIGDWDRFVIDIAVPTTVGDWLWCNVQEPYAHGGWWKEIPTGTSGKVVLPSEHNSTTSLALQAGNPNGPRDLFVNDIYFSKGEGSEEVKESILSTLGGTPVSAATAVGTKAFELTDVDVTGWKNFVITFSSPTVGKWIVEYDGTTETIAEGTTTYSFDVSGKTSLSKVTLSVGDGDFPRFNNFEKASLTYSEVVTMDAHANATIFSLDKAEGFDMENKKFSATGGWTFETPVDISQYLYLIITTTQCGNNGAWGVNITDNNGVKVGEEDYDWKETGTKGGKMWIDNWNHKNAICVNLSYLEDEKGLDLSKIKSLSFRRENGDLFINNVILTNYASDDFLGKDQYHTYTTGNQTRPYTKATDLEKYGTICLPYKAVASGAFIYSIAGKSAGEIALERVDGIMEAGKPYFYQTTDAVGHGTDNKQCNVQFFRADWEADLATPVENNGLIGTFSAITAPQGDNFYVLSGNKLYYTTDATVNVGANKAYIDKTKIVNKGGEAKAFIDFDEPEATGIDAVATAETLKGGKFYDLSGREVANPTRGLYIVNGKKVLIK